MMKRNIWRRMWMVRRELSAWPSFIMGCRVKPGNDEIIELF
jgi:hypothetical protein